MNETPTRPGPRTRPRVRRDGLAAAPPATGADRRPRRHDPAISAIVPTRRRAVAGADLAAGRRADAFATRRPRLPAPSSRRDPPRVASGPAPAGPSRHRASVREGAS